MSLTSFITEKDVRAKLRTIFPSSPIQLEQRPMCEPLTNHYTLVGTAFDYLLRFSLQRLHPHAVDQPWVAELAAMKHQYAFAEMYGKNRAEQAIHIVTEAKQHHLHYLQTGILTQELLDSTLLLAQLDPFFRAGKLDEAFGIIDGRDRDDLAHLFAIIPFEQFVSRSVCLLDPTFGSSRLVGGADVDLVLDGMIIDIKTTKFLQFKRAYIDQLLGYYLLYRLGGITGMPEKHVISHLGVYFSRHGYLYTLPIEQLASEATLMEFSAWFAHRARQTTRTIGS